MTDLATRRNTQPAVRPIDAAKARLTVIEHARSPEDEHELLAMLGLTLPHEQEPHHGPR